MLDMMIGRVNVQVRAAIQDTKSYDMLLGLDVLMPLRAVVDLDRMMMTMTHKGDK